MLVIMLHFTPNTQLNYTHRSHETCKSYIIYCMNTEKVGETLVPTIVFAEDVSSLVFSADYYHRRAINFGNKNANNEVDYYRSRQTIANYLARTVSKSTTEYDPWERLPVNCIDLTITEHRVLSEARYRNELRSAPIYKRVFSKLLGNI